MTAAGTASGGVGVRVEGVGVHHVTAGGVVRALDAVSLDVPAGTSLAVVGPSGSGKSTLLGLLGGLEVPTVGTVCAGPDVLSSLGDRQRAAYRRRSVGCVYQSDNLLPFLTVEENVALQLALAPRPPDGGPGAADLLARLGMAGEADRLPDQLSGGQRQRVAIARAVAHRPRLLLADEPTGALDARNAGIVVDLLLEARRQLGATLVIVTHDRSVASRLDRTVELRDGRLVPDAVRRAG